MWPKHAHIPSLIKIVHTFWVVEHCRQTSKRQSDEDRLIRFRGMMNISAQKLDVIFFVGLSHNVFYTRYMGGGGELIENSNTCFSLITNREKKT